jgi:hypothetical protein
MQHGGRRCHRRIERERKEPPGSVDRKTALSDPDRAGSRDQGE